MKVMGRTMAIVNTDAHDILRSSYFRKWVIPELTLLTLISPLSQNVNI